MHDHERRDHLNGVDRQLDRSHCAQNEWRIKDIAGWFRLTERGTALSVGVFWELIVVPLFSTFVLMRRPNASYAAIVSVGQNEYRFRGMFPMTRSLFFWEWRFAGLERR